MKATIIAAFLCVILSCIPISIPKDAFNVLYGIVGVLFSVGMSLIRDIQLIPTLYFLKTAKYQIVLREKWSWRII